MSEIGVKIIRALNAVSAVVIAFAGLWISITLIVHGSLSVSAYCGPLFFVLFGFLLVANELGYPKLLDEFGFLKTFLGRGLFYIFLAGVVCYAYAMINNSFVAADIYGSIFFSLGVIYLLMNFYPKGQLGNMSRSLQIE